jgi:hypothetical protein
MCCLPGATVRIFKFSKIEQIIPKDMIYGTYDSLNSDYLPFRNTYFSDFGDNIL